MNYKILISFIILSFLISCAEVQHSSGKVLENANSVLKSGSGNLWLPPERSEVKSNGMAQYDNNLTNDESMLDPELPVKRVDPIELEQNSFDPNLRYDPNRGYMPTEKFREERKNKPAVDLTQNYDRGDDYY